MSLAYDDLLSSPRIIIEAHVKPVAGTRFQPTGFPDLDAAVYETPDGTPMLLVESAQSMANRLEAVCWDEGHNRIVPTLEGLPYVNVKLLGLGSGEDSTNSLLEFHRLNSPYIMHGKYGNEVFRDILCKEMKVTLTDDNSQDTTDGDENDETTKKNPKKGTMRKEVVGSVSLRNLAQVCMYFDPNSLIHGIFLEKIAGRLRLPRVLSSFIEAEGVSRADSGGVKFDRVHPSKSDGFTSNDGYCNVIFHRVEYTAKKITISFLLDLVQIRGYGLAPESTRLLIALSLWKIRAFLDSSMRLRTACELELVQGEESIVAKRPSGFVLPSLEDLSQEVETLIAQCRTHFANPPITELTWQK